MGRVLLAGIVCTGIGIFTHIAYVSNFFAVIGIICIGIFFFMNKAGEEI